MQSLYLGCKREFPISGEIHVLFVQPTSLISC